MPKPEKLTEAFERIMRVKRLDKSILDCLNSPAAMLSPEVVGEYVALHNWHIYQHQGAIPSKWVNPKERVFWRS